MRKVLHTFYLFFVAFPCLFLTFWVTSRFHRDRFDRWRYGFLHTFCCFLNVFLCLFDTFSNTSRLYRNRFDRCRYGFAHILWLFQCISLFLLYFRLPNAFTATVSIVGGTVVHTCCRFLYAFSCVLLYVRLSAAFTATVSIVGGTDLQTFCCFFDACSCFCYIFGYQPLSPRPSR